VHHEYVLTDYAQDLQEYIFSLADITMRLEFFYERAKLASGSVGIAIYSNFPNKVANM